MFFKFNIYYVIERDFLSITWQVYDLSFVKYQSVTVTYVHDDYFF